MSNPNVAAYPSAIATDTILPPATDNYVALLTSGITAGSASIPVSVVPANFPIIISIDSEQILCSAAVGLNLTVFQRGFNGTTPASHNANVNVYGNVVAYLTNQTFAEIKAIETALGTNFNGPNTTTSIVNIAKKDPNTVNAGFYNFAQIQPGGSLTGGSSNTITLPAGINGLNGVDTNHYLYISGGTGTAEAVLITGGTYTPNLGGTVIFTPANNHSGAWTIQSATSGIQEAMIDIAGGTSGTGSGLVKLIAGQTDLYAIMTRPANSFIGLRGEGMGISRILTHGTTGDWILFPTGSGYVNCGDFTIADASNTVHTSGAMIHYAYCTYGSVDGIEVAKAWIGILSESSLYVQPKRCIVGANSVGILISTQGVNSGSNPSAVSGGVCSHNIVSLLGSAGSAMRVDGSTVGLSLDKNIASCVVPASSNDALRLVSTTSIGPLNEIQVNGGLYDAGGNGIAIIGDGTSYNNNWIELNGVEAHGTEFALNIDAKIQNVHINGGLFKGDTGTNKQSIFLRNCQNIYLKGVKLEATGSLAMTVDTATDIFVDGISIGRNGNVPTNGITFSNTVTRFTLLNSDLGAISTAANRVTNPTVPTGYVSLNNIGIGNTVGALNYVGTESGANNALVIIVPGVPLIAGMRFQVLLAHTLQAGANTISINGTVLNIKSHFNVANNIATVYAVNGVAEFLYDGTHALDVCQ